MYEKIIQNTLNLYIIYIYIYIIYIVYKGCTNQILSDNECTKFVHQIPTYIQKMSLKLEICFF